MKRGSKSAGAGSHDNHGYPGSDFLFPRRGGVAFIVPTVREMRNEACRGLLFGQLLAVLRVQTLLEEAGAEKRGEKREGGIHVVAGLGK